MGLKFDEKKGHTPIDEDEKQGLKISSITTQEELDEFEQLNIQKAVEYYFLKRKFKQRDILTEKFIKDVHKRMFSDVWAWAGSFRKSDKNIGIDWYQISVRLKQLVDNTQYWIEYSTFPEKEIALRFKHELVAIHPFPNGNGRHSRLMADIVMKHIFQKEPFSWGTKSLHRENDLQKKYIQALREADKGDYTPLIEFVEFNKSMEKNMKNIEKIRKNKSKENNPDLER